MSNSRVAIPIEKQVIAEPAVEERRRRPRINISMPIRVRTHRLTAAAFDEVCTTVDVSADGLRFVTTRDGYQQGLELVTTFPYGGGADAHRFEREAVVVRVIPMPDEKFEVALRFRRVAKAAGEGARSSTQIPDERLPLRAVVPLVIAIDHDDRSRSALVFALERDGYEVLAFRATSQALEVLRNRVPAVLIADVESEDISGYDLCLIVKGDRRLQDVPVVLTTKSGLPSDYATAHALGAIICMTKPYKRDRLLMAARLLATPTSENAAGRGGVPFGSAMAFPAATNSKYLHR